MKKGVEETIVKRVTDGGSVEGGGGCGHAQRLCARIDDIALALTSLCSDCASHSSHLRFELIARKKVKLTPAQVKVLYATESTKQSFKSLSEFMTSAPVLCLAVRRNHALTELQTLLGPENPKVAKKSHPNSLRSVYGTDPMKNAVHCADNLTNNTRDVALIFGEYNFDLLN
jgi:nucleoside-diphosphate kinase